MDNATVHNGKAMYKGIQNWSVGKEDKLRTFISLLQIRDNNKYLISDAVEKALDIGIQEIKKTIAI